MGFLIVVIFGVIFGIVSAIIADSRGRSAGGWLFMGLLFGPLGLVVALLPSSESALQAQARQSGEAEGWRKCPACAGVVRAEATVCRYCGRDLPTRPGHHAAHYVPTPTDKDWEAFRARHLTHREAAAAVWVPLATIRSYVASGRLRQEDDGTILGEDLEKAGFVIRTLG